MAEAAGDEVVGAGAEGLTADITAFDRGRSVAILEDPRGASKNPRIKITQPNAFGSKGNPELQALKAALEDALQAADPIAIINRTVPLEGTFLHVKSIRVGPVKIR